MKPISLFSISFLLPHQSLERSMTVPEGAADEGCGIIDPIFKKGAEELKNWGPAEFTIGRH